MLFTGNQISAREITRILIIKIVTILLPIYIPDYSAIKNFSNFLLLRVIQVNYWLSALVRQNDWIQIFLCMSCVFTDEDSYGPNLVKSLSTSYSFKVKMLGRISFLLKATLENIFYKTVIPSVLYGIGVWGSCSDWFDEIPRTNPPQSCKRYSQTTMRHEDETVLINANWMPFKYFCSRFSYFIHNV